MGRLNWGKLKIQNLNLSQFKWPVTPQKVQYDNITKCYSAVCAFLQMEYIGAIKVPIAKNFWDIDTYSIQVRKRDFFTSIEKNIPSSHGA